MTSLIDYWLRRSWRPIPTAATKLVGNKPITVITGASRGIGQALALELAKRGHNLMLIARGEDELTASAKIITEMVPATTAPDRLLVTLALDITSHGALEKLVLTLDQHDAYIDILVNNAGFGLAGDFAEQSPAEIQSLIDLNISAATRLMRHALPDMLTRGRGGIINIASLGGLVPGPFQAAYFASKAYLISLSRATAWEIRGQGVRVCAVAPGPVETSFHARMNAESALYRKLLPASTSAQVARSALRGYNWGLSIVTPGVLDWLMSVALNILPTGAMIPLLAILMRPRSPDPK